MGRSPRDFAVDYSPQTGTRTQDAYGLQMFELYCLATSRNMLRPETEYPNIAEIDLCVSRTADLAVKGPLFGFNAAFYPRSLTEREFQR